MRIVAASLCIAGAALAASGTTAAAGPDAVFRTQLFNLLSNEKSVLDGKNHYDAAFAARFDALLATSRLSKADQNKVSLKKRLLSGPAPEGAPATVAGSAAQWFYYEACQAHVCDETSLGLLYEPASRRMLGKLHLNKQFEYLGAPSEAEKRVLDRNMPGG